PGPVVAVIWIVALVAVVGVGIASHPAWGPDASGPPTQLPVALRPVPSHLVKSPPGVINPAPSPVVDSDLIALEIAPASRGIAVSGTVRSRSIVWVFLSLETADG